MKDIKDMNLSELAHHLEHHVHYTRLEMIAVIERLRELHEQNRWIPVEERLPDEVTDGDLRGAVLTRGLHGGVEATHCRCVLQSIHKEWKRITTLE